MYECLDMPLISAFVERWQPETNTFHLPFGEMTITLHDVFYLLRIPIEGKPVISTQTSQSCLGDMGLLLNLRNDDQLALKTGFKSGRCKIDAIENLVPTTSESLYTAYLLWLLGAILFVDKTSSLLHIGFVEFLHDRNNVANYSWGAATLANLYRQLGEATRAKCKEIAGCLTLLQVQFFTKSTFNLCVNCCSYMTI